MRGMSGYSKVGSGLRIRQRKVFPDLRVPQASGGRFSGLAQGIGTAIQMQQINRQNAMNEMLLNMMMRKESQGIFVKALDSYEKELDRISKLNIEGVKTSSPRNPYIPISPPTRQEYIQSYIQSLGLNIKVPGQPLTRPIAQPRIGGALIGEDRTLEAITGIKPKSRTKDILSQITGFQEGGIVNRPTMAMVGEGGKEYIAPASKLDPQMQAKLEAILGKPNTQGGQTNNNAPEGQPWSISGPSTEDLIAALDDYDNVDEAIADLVELDRQYNQPGLAFADNIDYDAFKQAFIAKFGEAGYRKLEASVS